MARDRRPARRWSAVPLLTAALALATTGCGERAGTAPPAQEPQPVTAETPRPTRGYVVISLDTLRADHLGCYGYDKPTSPFLDELARRATLFEEAYAPFPSTLVSHMTMFTGLHPREHGVFPPNSVLPEEIGTFPEAFQRAGFRTAAYTEGGYMSGRYGFRRGFDDFVARARDGGRRVEQTFQRGAEFLATLGPEDRFLLFLHTYAIHTPYDAPQRFQELFWPGDPPAGAIPVGSLPLVRHNLVGDPLPQPVVDHVTAAYDAGIRQTDEVLRGFFAEVERLGLADEVTVVITSDHGEELQDHGKFVHSQLYREVMRVPLLVLHPDRREAVRQPAIVHLGDLAPTLYELARLQPTTAPSGRSLAGFLGVQQPALPGDVFMDGETGERALYRRRQGRLESLLLADHGEQWVARRLAFDVAGGEVAFEVRAYERPRRLTVDSAGERLAEVALGVDWQPLRLTLPEGPARLQLTADGCSAPGGAVTLREPQCHGFQVRGVRTTRLELYDLAADPRQRRDLSWERRSRARELLRDLLAFRPRPRGAAVAPPPIDPELENSLRALGYVE